MTIAVCDMSLMRGIVGIEGEDSQPSSREAHTACFFLAPPTKHHVRVRCDALVQRSRASMYVVERSPLITVFRWNFVQNNIRNFVCNGCRSEPAGHMLPV